MSENRLPPLTGIYQGGVNLPSIFGPILHDDAVIIDTKADLEMVMRPNILKLPTKTPMISMDATSFWLRMEPEWHDALAVPSRDQTNEGLHEKIVAYYQAARVRELLLSRVFYAEHCLRKRGTARPQAYADLRGKMQYLRMQKANLRTRYVA